MLDPNRDEHLVDGLAITKGPHFIGQCFQEEPATIWLDYFYQFNRSNGAKLFPELFSAYSCTDQDEAFNKDESENDDNTESESEEDSFEIETESEEDTTEEDTSENDTNEEDCSDVPISDTISTDEDNVSGDV